MSGRALVGIIQISMICEISSIFLIIRFFLDGKKPLALINNCLIFFTFFIFRILLFPLTYYGCFKSFTLYDFWGEGKLHVFFIVILFFSFLGIYILNIFWFSLMIKSLNKENIKKIN